MAKARSVHGLSEDDPYCAAAARVVAVRAAELAENAAGALDTSDIERVHDLRVATRRLRAALEVFEPCFPRKRFRPALREVKALADALGERRDRDVTIVALSEFAAAIGRADRPGVESLIARVREEQAEANLTLAPHVSEERMAALVERLDELVGDAARVGEPEPTREPEPEARVADTGAVREAAVTASTNGGGAG